MSTNIDASLTGGAAASNGPAVSNGTDPVPTSEAEIDELRQEIDRLDAEILAAVKRRAEVSRLIGRTRMASGGTRLVHSREMKVLERFSELGQEGHTLAMLLLRLGRGRLGH
ncbi:chorismate mutase [Rhodococcus artemisiae]|uniref:Chorismate mutase n=1 Tax=Rhodococcus artemisiae TaxID=714159 RepID=A0ABU7LEU5_9NOCA|nr:chorismate mutase [Rhodococcus artemisiae]MEE2059804.1 chorismate mutase [Rhodococcus artemisiae]